MPAVNSNPYDSAEDILNLARSMANDASTSNGLAGDIMADSQPYVFPILQKCYRDLQDYLITGGVETFSKYGEIDDIPPPVSGLNQRVNVQIDYIGYWNGDTINQDVTLPPDLIKPLEMWQAASGQTFWSPMRQVPDSIASRNPAPLPGVWDFENDKLILPQATLTYSIKLKYLCYAPDLTAPDAQVYVLHCQTALANMFVAQVCKMLGGTDMAAICEADSKKAIDLIINRTARKEQYTSFQRIPFRSRGNGIGRGR